MRERRGAPSSVAKGRTVPYTASPMMLISTTPGTARTSLLRNAPRLVNAFWQGRQT